MSRSTTRLGPVRRRLVPAAAALSVLAVACGGGTSDEPTADPVPDAMSTPADDAAMADGEVASDSGSDAVLASEPEADPVAAPSIDGGDAASLATAKQRCVVGLEAMERRIEAEGFEWPDEGPELSEEELEQILTPEYPNVDGVASPDERAPIELMPAFDPETVPIPELDHLVGACIEGGIVTEAELFGEEEGEGDWCAELAELDADVIAEFAAEEGEDVVRAEFAECGLPDPFGT